MDGLSRAPQSRLIRSTVDNEMGIGLRSYVEPDNLAICTRFV
jgi:hypothetical protein